MVKSLKNIILFLLFLFLTFTCSLLFEHLNSYIEIKVENTQEFIDYMEKYFNQGKYGYAKLFADFILEEGIFSKEEKYVAQTYKDRILEIENSILHRIKSFLKGALTGEAEDFAGIVGVAFADTLVLGDIRDLIKEGYKAITGEEYSKLTLALSTVGLLTTVTPFMDTSVSILKVFTKLNAVNKTFLEFILETVKKGDLKSLKRVLKYIYEGFSYTKEYGLKVYADIFSFVKTEADLKKLVKLLKENGLPRTYIALKHFNIPLEKLKRVIKFKKTPENILEFIINFLIESFLYFIGKILSFIGFLASLVLLLVNFLILLYQIVIRILKVFLKVLLSLFPLPQRTKMKRREKAQKRRKSKELKRGFR